MQRFAKPCTSVQFRSGPPFFLLCLGLQLPFGAIAQQTQGCFCRRMGAGALVQAPLRDDMIAASWPIC
jgi:hypothetical protein